MSRKLFARRREMPSYYKEGDWSNLLSYVDRVTDHEDDKGEKIDRHN